METRRPTTPEAEEILGLYYPVLDHGFVSLVDYMGSDESIEHAARVSYGYGTRKRSATRGLIRYLRRHLHTTPSEMVELKFHCAMPMFVARQWVRHRTACVAEGTEVFFDLPGAEARGRRQLYKLPIEEIWRRFQPTRNRTRPDKQRNRFFRRDRVRGMKLRQVNEDTLAFQHTRILGVYRNGRKPVFRMVLDDGKSIEATSDHRFLFATGWQTLRRATGLREVGGRAVWRPGDHFAYVNGAAEERPAFYRDPIWLQREYRGHRRSLADLAQACGVTVHTIRKWLRHYRLTEPGRGCFEKGARPWNRGTTYQLGPREPSKRFLAAIRTARSGPASNFWRGGRSDDRASIGRWTTQIAARIHAGNGWTCQLCEERRSELHCHHIVPVWADLDRARDPNNLTTLCGDCHRSIAGRELDFVERLGGPPVKSEWVPRPRIPWNRLDKAKLVRIRRFEFVGERETYDLEVEGPYHNFVANGIVTHNSINEYSGRYSLMPLLFYSPDPGHFSLQSSANNQGREEDAASERLYEDAIQRWEDVRASASRAYTWMVQEDVARELARIDLPLSTYTQWYWKIDLHNLLHFLTLRVDDHAQWEIQEFGRVMAGMLKRVAPMSFEAWIDYQVCGDKLSRMEIDALARLLEATPDGGLAVRGDRANLGFEDLRGLGMAPREVRELVAKIRRRTPPDFDLDMSRFRSAEDVAAEMHEAVPGNFE